MSDQPDPLYVHDGCPRCTYLGTWENSVDLWFCPQVGFPIVIARFSSEHFDYTSGINSWSPALVEAKTRAAERGLWTPESRTGEDCRRAGTLDAGVANRRGLIPMTAALKEYIRRLAKEYRCDSAGDDERRTGYLSLVLPLVVNQAFKELHALGYDDRKFLDKPGAIVHEWQDGSFEVVIYDSKEELLAAWDGWVVAVRDGVPADFVFDPTAVPAPPQPEAWTQFCLELERARHACSLALDFLAVLDRNGDLDYYAGSDTLTTTRDALRGVVRRHETDPKSADAAETSSRTRT